MNGVLLLVPSTTFDNGETKITGLMCNELNETEPNRFMEMRPHCMVFWA